MLSGYDFSNCDIPVRLNHFFVCECWSGREGSPKNSLRSDNRKLFWEKAVLWRGSSQNATMTGLRSEFLFHTEVLLENWDLLNSENKKKKRTFRELKSGEYFQSAAESRKNQKHKQVWSVSDGGAARCTWHEMWGQPVQPVQQTTATATERPWQKQRDNLIQAAGRDGGGRREGGVMWLQTF